MCSIVALLALGQTGPAQSVPAPVVGIMPPVIVIGFVGGFIRHDNLAHSEVQLAARLRQAYPLGVEVQTFESYRRGRARNRIMKLLDANHDGNLIAGEKLNARIIIYGHSWGGSEALNLARQLEKDGIPVLLIVQVDSISIRHNDRVHPGERGPGRELLSAAWASPRPVLDPRRRSNPHGDYREFSVRLQSE